MTVTKLTQNIKQKLFLFSFMMVCFFFGNNLNAQNYPPLVSDAHAETMLHDYIPNLEAQMNSHNEGTAEYAFAERMLNLYTHTWETLVFGKQLEVALTDAYGEFAVDANGNSLDMDELPSYTQSGPDYGDAAFDNLVNFLTL